MPSPALEDSSKGPTVSERGGLHVVHLLEALGPGGAERLLHKFNRAISPMKRQLVGNETI